MQCREVMRQHVATLPPEASAADAARMMAEHGCGMIPICSQDGSLAGVITDRDIVVRVCSEGRSPSDARLSEVMTRELVVCAPSDALQTAEELMIRHKKSRIAVVDGERLVGVISLTDIAQYEEPLRLARLVREISSREYRLEHS
jgi:CBS domain-containing protein